MRRVESEPAPCQISSRPHSVRHAQPTPSTTQVRGFGRPGSNQTRLRALQMAGPGKLRPGALTRFKPRSLQRASDAWQAPGGCARCPPKLGRGTRAEAGDRGSAPALLAHSNQRCAGRRGRPGCPRQRSTRRCHKFQAPNDRHLRRSVIRAVAEQSRRAAPATRPGLHYGARRQCQWPASREHMWRGRQ